MKDKTWYEETKEELIKNINNRHTLNLALEILEERQSLLNESLKKEEIINKAIEYINSNPNVFYDEYLIDVETLKNNEMKDEIVGEIRFISNLLDMLKEKLE